MGLTTTFLPKKGHNILIGNVIGTILENRPDVLMDGTRLKMLRDAIDVSWLAHVAQKRKYTHEPYIVHPTAVAAHATKIGMSMFAVAAAFLHDVLEDTHVTVDVLREFFPEKVVMLVVELTKVEDPGSNRATRKEGELRRLCHVSAEAQTLKLIDRIDNLSSIMEHDPKFAEVYVKESTALLAALTEAEESVRLLLGVTINGYKVEVGDAPVH